MEKETHTDSENMKKFFDKLTDLKAFVKEKAEETNNQTIKEIYNRLDYAFKLKRE